MARQEGRVQRQPQCVPVGHAADEAYAQCASSTGLPWAWGSNSQSRSRSLGRRQRRRLHSHCLHGQRCCWSSRCQGQQQLNCALSRSYLPSHTLSCCLAHGQPPMRKEKGAGVKQHNAGPNSAHALHVRAPNVGQEGKSRARLPLVADIQRQLRWGGTQWAVWVTQGVWWAGADATIFCLVLSTGLLRLLRAQHVKRWFAVIFLQ